ncbi:hypothetical protein, partial [Klebsiella pneumoniae]|uniref:hypothetical protein n=1 Tax=Klebsiella pneumoniae TaxID=573 RepID=UPI001BE050E5
PLKVTAMVFAITSIHHKPLPTCPKNFDSSLDPHFSLPHLLPFQASMYHVKLLLSRFHLWLGM